MSTSNVPQMSPGNVSFSSAESAAISGSVPEVSSDALISAQLTSLDLDGHDPSVFLTTFNLLRRDANGEFFKELSSHLRRYHLNKMPIHPC